MIRQRLATFRSLKWLDYIYYALLEPRRLPSRIEDETSKPYSGAFMIVLGVSFTEILASSLLMVNNAYFYQKITYGLVLFFVINVVQISVIVLLIDGLCQYLGHAGKVKTLFAIAAYSQFPKLFLLPLTYIVKVIPFAPLFSTIIFSLGLTVWSALIAIVGISEMHSIPFTKSVLVYLFPYIAVGLVLFFIIVLAFINIAGYIMAWLVYNPGFVLV